MYVLCDMRITRLSYLNIGFYLFNSSGTLKMICNVTVVRKQAENKDLPVDAVYQVFVIRCSAINSVRNTNGKIKYKLSLSVSLQCSECFW